MTNLQQGHTDPTIQQYDTTSDKMINKYQDADTAAKWSPLN